ncbi:hypothetical protein Gferi_24310 [Geosporobacter ferrireducens]|uniref:AAA+ ATPase domain-containing protein n=2 Tax=Geosporobacter ferrireducens TaxID=1424294 RepID=A0A1D8GQR7_9FIRM|nr:MoxR family ATPase [Geosporobacter ferrireducens]AOT73285.1 hypothetical protein Gferi_24310 [Geosporobacter ferrireducens]MTI56345.1 MoxR family ATPase [Geosporobacter ferrireducens]
MKNMETVVVGKQEAIEKIVIALLCRGHILIEDVPGVGKTTLAQALARSIDCSFSRIQFTPDLIPSDLLGVSIYNQKEGVFQFIKGPIHSQIILADEINRTSPKTQSSLLEVMQEQQITVDGTTYKISDPFMVIATQNPIEYEGTFPLPEAQLDRFLFKITLGYPSLQEEIKVIQRKQDPEKFHQLEPVVSPIEISAAREAVEGIYVDGSIEEYIVKLIRATREDEHILLGASPRAAAGLYHAAKAYAYIKKRSYLLPDDVKNIIYSALTHRLIMTPEAKFKGYKSIDVIESIIKKVNVPLVRSYE